MILFSASVPGADVGFVHRNFWSFSFAASQYGQWSLCSFLRLIQPPHGFGSPPMKYMDTGSGGNLH
jgi:hypothetical protein